MKRKRSHLVRLRVISILLFDRLVSFFHYIEKKQGIQGVHIEKMKTGEIIRYYEIIRENQGKSCFFKDFNSLLF